MDLRKLKGNPRDHIDLFKKEMEFNKSKIRANNMRRAVFLVRVFPKEYYPMLAKYEKGFQYEVINWISEVAGVNRRTAYDIWICLRVLYSEFRSLDEINKEKSEV